MNDNNRIALNSVINFAQLCIVSLIGIIISRIVLDALGASDYGLYNVVGGIVALLNVLNTAMTTTTYRFVAYELGKKGKGNVNKVFNTVFLIHAAFALLILVAGLVIGLWYINNYLNVEPGKLPDARFVYIVSIITTAISTVMVPYQGLLTAYEKFSVHAIINIGSDIIKFALILLFIYSDSSRIRIFSIISAFYVLLQKGCIFTYCYKKYFQVIRFHIYRDKKLLKEILSFTSYILIGAGSAMAETQGSVVVVNYFFGTIVNAGFAVANTIKGFISVFSANLSRSAIPQITKNFSGGNQGRSINLACYISKYTIILMLVVAFPVIMEMDFLLDLWLKEVPENTALYCVLTILIVLISGMGEGIYSLISASGKIKKFQLINGGISLLGIPIAFVAFKYGFPAFAILVVYAIIKFLNTFVRLILIKTELRFNISPFFKISYLKVFYIAIPLIVAYIYYDPSHFSILGHFAGLIGSELFLVSIVWVVGFEKRERQMVMDLIKGANTRIRKKIMK